MTPRFGKTKVRVSEQVRGPGPGHRVLVDVEPQLIFKDAVNLWVLQSQKAKACAYLNGEPQAERSSETGLSVFL